MEKIFYNPEVGLRSKSQMVKMFKQKGYTAEAIEEFLNKQQVNQITQPHHDRIYHTIVGAEAGSYQCDLMFYTDDKKYNHGYIGMLLCLELTSRKLFVYPIKNKSNPTMIQVLTQFIEDAEPNTITTDNGKEFNSHAIDELFEANQITHWLKEMHDRTTLGKVDRVTRTVRDLITRYQKAYETKNWYDVIGQLITNYNNRPHSSLFNYTPNEVFDNPNLQSQVRDEEFANGEDAIRAMEQFEIGDKVHVLLNKNPFEKGEPTWSKTIHTIIAHDKFNYTLTDAKRTYRQHEMQKVEDTAENPYINDPIDEDDYKKDKRKRKLNKVSAKEIDATENEQGELQPDKHWLPAAEKRVSKKPTKF